MPGEFSGWALLVALGAVTLLALLVGGAYLAARRSGEGGPPPPLVLPPSDLRSSGPTPASRAAASAPVARRSRAARSGRAPDPAGVCPPTGALFLPKTPPSASPVPPPGGYQGPAVDWWATRRNEPGRVDHPTSRADTDPTHDGAGLGVPRSGRAPRDDGPRLSEFPGVGGTTGGSDGISGG